jgi:hypothetical protein
METIIKNFYILNNRKKLVVNYLTKAYLLTIVFEDPVFLTIDKWLK